LRLWPIAITAISSTADTVDAGAAEGRPATGNPDENKDKDKRSLRSHSGTSRTKSDLSRFFSDYEENVFGPLKEKGEFNAGSRLWSFTPDDGMQDCLTSDSILYLVETSPRKARLPKYAPPRFTPSLASSNGPGSINAGWPGQGSISNEVENSSPRTAFDRLDLSLFEADAKKYDRDPLSADVFRQAHRRGERKEKQLRNIEKEHAMHEKGDLERLLGELKGHDWLKTMGISGITDSDKKGFEAKRDAYIRAVQTLIDKFSSWREQEKELKFKKDQANLFKCATEHDSEVAGSEEVSVDGYNVIEVLDDADASARQLHREAIIASHQEVRPRGSRRHLIILEPESATPFVSFFSKPYLREAALGKHRRGRSATAFGLAIPEPPAADFALPDDFISEDTLKENARKRRRLKRGLISDAGGK